MDTTLSILYTVPLLSERLSLRKDNEKVYVIYLSDLVEIHNPSNESNGYFSFLKSKTNIIDALSVQIARNQIKKESSAIGKIITRCKNKINNCEIIVFRPGLIKVNPDEDGNQRFIIDDLWKDIFKELETSIKIQKLSDLENNFEFQ